MRKHIYVHTSTQDYLRDINEDVEFESVAQYDPISSQKCYKNEYGRIKTKGNYYHIMIGEMKQENCPWCNSPAVLKKVYDGVSDTMTPSEPDQYCMICTQCGSRGPLLNLNQHVVKDPKFMTYIEQCIKDRYESRRQWDSHLINPYEV
jgi:hypothetical protein